MFTKKDFLRRDQLEKLHENVFKVLETAGIKVEDETILDILAKKGGMVNKATKIVKFPAQLINETIALHKEDVKQGKTAIREEKYQKFSPRIGGLSLYYLDSDKKERRKATTDDLIQMIKLANGIEEVVAINAPLTSSEFDPLIEPLEALKLLIQYSDKKIKDIHCIEPEQVKYMVEIGKLLPNEAKNVSFVDPVNYFTSPLILSERCAKCLKEKIKYKIPAIIGTMPLAGGNAPVTIAGSSVIGAAEVLGGWVVAKAIDPEIPVGGFVCSGLIDMATASMTSSSPETILQDIALYHLFDQFYGGEMKMVGISFVTAKLPGAQAVFEKTFKTLTAAINTAQDPFNELIGILDTGNMFSPVQAMIDLEFGEAMWRFAKGEIEVSDESIGLETIKDVGIDKGRTYLNTNHTLKYFKNYWFPKLLDRTAWLDYSTEQKKEGRILEKANERWKEILKKYKSPVREGKLIKEVDRILETARKDIIK